MNLVKPKDAVKEQLLFNKSVSNGLIWLSSLLRFFLIWSFSDNLINWKFGKEVFDVTFFIRSFNLKLIFFIAQKNSKNTFNLWAAYWSMGQTFAQKFKALLFRMLQRPVCWTKAHAFWWDQRWVCSNILVLLKLHNNKFIGIIIMIVVPLCIAT
jgi:hypothetical protein